MVIISLIGIIYTYPCYIWLYIHTYPWDYNHVILTQNDPNDPPGDATALGQHLERYQERFCYSLPAWCTSATTMKLGD